MRAIVKRNANAVLAVVVSLLCAVSLLGTPAKALAEDTDNEISEQSIVINGVDFMEPTAIGWDLLRVDKGAGKTVYLDIKQGDKFLMHRAEYAIPASNANEDGTGEDYMGSGDQVAQIVAVNSWLKDQDGNPADLKTLMGTLKDGAPGITITVWDSAREGTQLFDGAVYPVFAKLVDGDEVLYQPLGIRTVAVSSHPVEKSVGGGSDPLC